MKNDDRIDSVLATLVRVANEEEADNEIRVTLTVGGATVTGILMGDAAWFEAQVQVKGFAEQSRKDRADGEAVLAAVDAVEGVDVRWLRAVYNESNVHYLHLRNARFVAGSQLVPSRKGDEVTGMFWRCKLSDVSGWALGSLGDAAPSA